MFTTTLKVTLAGLFLSIIIFQAPLWSQAPAKKVSAFEFITQKEGAAIQLEFDLTELLNNKKSTHYYPAGLTLEDGTSIAAEVRARGKFRRRVSEVPPLKIKFSKKDMRALGLDTLNEVRLVLPCSFTPEDEARVLREYIAYRMYERLSSYHVKARLIQITLRDSHVESSRPQVWAILLEHDEEIAVRLHGGMEKNFGVLTDSVDASHAALNAVFQYMIGNTDWSMMDARNIYQFRPAAGGKIIPIPYDFDFSGLVDASYATPTKESGLLNVRERALIASGISASDIQKALDTLKSAESDLQGICKLHQLDAHHSKQVEEYIAAFFTAIRSSGKTPGKIKAAK